MQQPSQQQEIYCHLTMVTHLLGRIKEGTYLSNMDDLKLISDIDKARLFLMQALDRIQTIEEKAQKNVCY